MPEKWKLIDSSITVVVIGTCNMRVGYKIQTPGVIYTDKKGETTVRTLEEFKRIFAPIE